jgi:rifampicin phosphotransferase
MKLVINAAWGLGEAIVSGRVTPDTIVVDKRNRTAIASQEVADKETMTVRTGRGHARGARSGRQAQTGRPGPAQAAELARLGVKIEELYGRAMDIEWAMNGGRIFIVQARPVTVLPDSHAAPEWRCRSKGRQYWRSSVAELLPDPLSPLFATLALPALERGVAGEAEVAAMQLLIGRDVGLVTIHEYAYYSFCVDRVADGAAALRVARADSPGRPHDALGRNPVGQLRRGRATQGGRRPGPRATWTATPALELLAGARDIVAAAAGYYVSIQLVLGPANCERGRSLQTCTTA